MSEREAALRDRIDADPGDAAALKELAERVGSDRERRGEAIDLWSRYVESAEGSERAAALLALARAQIEARREPDAIDTLGRCVTEDPERAEAWDLCGELLRRAGRLDEALRALTRAAELEPDAIRPRVALVACYDALGRHEEATAMIEAVRRIGGANPAVEALVQELMQRRG